jgi:hypothetical protein
MNDPADEERRATEERCGRIDPSLSKERSDPGAAHRGTVDHQGRDSDDADTLRFPDTSQEGEIPSTTAAEAEPFSDHDRPRGKPLDEHATHKLFRRDLAHFAEVRPFDPFDLPLEEADLDRLREEETLLDPIE